MGAPLMAITVGAGLVGAAINAGASGDALRAQSANAAYQAQVARNNAAIATQNATMDTQSGEIAAVNQGLKTRAAVGKTLAAQGASGIDVNVGSAPKVRAAESELGLLDAMTIRSNAAKKAYADTVQATSFTAEGGLLGQEASQATSAIPEAEFGTFLSGASTVGSSLGKYLQSA